MADDSAVGGRRPGVIASDLDGTLFGLDHKLSGRTVEVLSTARRAGWMVIAATGRAPRSAMDRLARHNVVDGLICSNGSIIHDVSTDTTLRRYTINPDHLASLFAALDTAVPELSFCWEMRNGSAWDHGFDDIARTHDDLRKFQTGPRPDSATAVTKVMVRHPEAVGNELAEWLLPHLPAPLTLNCSGVDFVEITGVGVDKSRALAHMLDEAGFCANDVVAFGDNHNDVQMLRWAGRGVAVGNAVDAAKRAADEVTGHHSDDSVAEYIESLL